LLKKRGLGGGTEKEKKKLGRGLEPTAQGEIPRKTS